MSTINQSGSPGSPLARILVVSMGTAGDLYPMLALARVLARRGHPITMLAAAVHEATVTSAGLEFVALGTRDDYRKALDDPDLWDWRKGFDVVWRTAMPSLEFIPDVVAAQPANQPLLMLAHPLALPGAAIARALRPDMQIVSVWLAPANLRAVRDLRTLGPISVPSWLPLFVRRALWRLVDARIVDPVVLPGLNAVRARRGLPPVRHFVRHFQDVGARALTLFPAWYGPEQAEWPKPMLPGDFPLFDPDPDWPMPADLQDFLSEGEAPIVFTAGTGNVQAARYFEHALQACRQLGARAILLTSQRSQVPAALPAHAFWCAYAPLRRLLEHARVLVHHGGIGTTAEALRSGVRQLVVPLAHDQFDNAARVRSLGAGFSLPAARIDDRRLEQVLRRLLDDATIGARCHEVAVRFARAPDLERMANWIVAGQPGDRPGSAERPAQLLAVPGDSLR